MAYQVIARKYRPQRFVDVVGQGHVTQTLANAIQQSRIAHAYIFCGPRGTGKTTIARIFAKCLNCTNGPRVEFALDDPRCVEIAEGRSLDVIEIDGASNNSVDQIRDLRDTVSYAPANSPYKVYIIDEVHMLTAAAFNALLKTLEEPPAHVKFMFATTEPEKVLPTILSRCQRFDLRRIPAGLIVEHLSRIAQQEGVEVEETALHAIARSADGGMRDAESTLDQLISFCGTQIEEAAVLSMFGLTAHREIAEMSQAILVGDIPGCLNLLDRLARQGIDLSRLLPDLLRHFRNLLIRQVAGQNTDLLEVSETETTTLNEQVPLTSHDAITRIMEVFSEFEARLRNAPSKRILIEVALLKAVEARNAVSIDQVLGTLADLREKSASASPNRSPEPAPARSPAAAAPPKPKGTSQLAPSKPAPTERPAPTTPPLSDNQGPTDLKLTWQRVVDRVGRASPFAKSYLLQAHPVELTANVFTIGFTPGNIDNLELADHPKNHGLIQEALAELGCGKPTIRFISNQQSHSTTTENPVSKEPGLKPTPAQPAPPPPSPARTQRTASSEPAEPMRLSKEDFKNDPKIKKALEVFRGQIVDIIEADQ